MLKHRIVALAATAALALTTAVAAAPAAEASHNCPAGSTCVYDAQHRLVYRNAGNANVRLAPGGGHVWNNGVRLPGLDHINLTVEAFGARYAICLHYGRWTLSEPDPTVAILWDQAVVTGWRWRGECAESEENWHQF